jgi:hypothetical protein
VFDSKFFTHFEFLYKSRKAITLETDEFGWLYNISYNYLDLAF